MVGVPQDIDLGKLEGVMELIIINILTRIRFNNSNLKV